MNPKEILMSGVRKTQNDIANNITLLSNTGRRNPMFKEYLRRIDDDVMLLALAFMRYINEEEQVLKDLEEKNIDKDAVQE